MPPGSRMDGSDSANELGRPVVTNLSGGGYSVVAADRDEGKLEGLLDEVHREVADPTDPSVAAPLIDRIVRDEGPPHILVDTLGAFIPGEALATAPNQLRTMLDVNLGAALWLTQAVVPDMVQRVSGAILHVSARPALDPTPGMAAYSASKAPLTQFTRTLDEVLRPLGIRVKVRRPNSSTRREIGKDSLRSFSLVPLLPRHLQTTSHFLSVMLQRPSVERFCLRTARGNLL
jgi:short-subunit dehydrogenase